MKIIFHKLNHATHQLIISKEGSSIDSINLDTKTYFLHDVVHYVVETELRLKNGFWGMMQQGYKAEQLKGKTNELSKELRKIEHIVGPVQSVYSGYMTEQLFEETLNLNNFATDANFIASVKAKIDAIMRQWELLPTGQALELIFEI